MYGLAADLHLHCWSAFASTDPAGVNTRLKGLLSEIRRLSKEVHEAGGDTVIFAGDVFHVRGSVNPIVLNSAKDEMAECNRLYGTKFVIIPGNHDLTGKNSERLGSAVTALECAYVTVNAATHYYLDHKVVLVPWFERIDDLKAEIASVLDFLLDTDRTVCEWDLILHAPIDGVIEGLPAHGLDADWLASQGFKRVFSGHYHNHKCLYDGSDGSRTYMGQVFSIGALAHLTWSDVNSKAGFLLVGDTVNWRKSHLPQFIDLAQLAVVDPEEVPLLVDGNYVRCKVEADKAKEVEAARKELTDMGALAVLVQSMPKAPARAAGTAPTIAAGASLEVSVGNFIKGLTTVRHADETLAAAMDVLASVDTSGD